MGTRAVVGYKEEGSEHTIFSYVHCNGRPRWCGAGILEHFNTPSKAKNLAYIGEIYHISKEEMLVEWETEPEAAKALKNRNKDTIKKYFHCYYAYVYVHNTATGAGWWEWTYLLDDDYSFKKLTEKDVTET